MAEPQQASSTAAKIVRLPAKMRTKFSRGRHLIAIDVDGQVLRVVQTKGGKITGFAAESLNLAPDADLTDPVVVGLAILKALARLRVRLRQVVMGVPRAQVVLRTMILPETADPREMASMVHFQIAKDLPFPMEEAVIDFKVQSHAPATAAAPRNDEAKEAEPGGAKVEVLVAVVKRDVVAHYQKIADAAGLKLSALGLRSYANARCVQACNLAQGTEGVALISLRPDEVIIDVIQEKSLVFSRVASVKKHAETETEPDPGGIASGGEGRETREESFLGSVTIEVVRSLHSYAGVQQHHPVTKIVVAGSTGDEILLVEALQKRLHIPCTLLDPASALGLTHIHREHTPGAIAAFGLGLGVNDPEGLPFDFLNPKRPPVRRDLRRIKTLAIAALVAVSFTTLFGVREYLKRQRALPQTEIRAELEEAKKRNAVYTRTRNQVRSIDQWLKEERRWLDHMAYLSAVLPPSTDLYVTSISSSSGGAIRMAVQARSGEVLARLDKQLREAGYDVKPLAVTPSPDKYGYGFKSTLEVEIPARLNIDPAKMPAPPSRLEDDGSLDPPAPRERPAGSTASSERPNRREVRR
jgi:type IV pilus assembly protein PilM